MKLDSKMKKLIEQNSFSGVLNGLLKVTSLEKLMLEICNQCVFKSNSDKTKKRRYQWHRAARALHRLYDELNQEKKKRNVFKVMRRDYYLCPKCKKKFRVDPLKGENCAFILDRGMVVVKCPHCGFSE